MTFRTFLLIFLFISFFLHARSQDEKVYYNTEWQMGKLHRHDPTGIPVIRDWGFQEHVHPPTGVMDPDAPGVPPVYHSPAPEFKGSQVNGTVVQVGRNFEGNHLYNTIPADNSIAVSDSGLIVSIDNATVAYFRDNSDTIVKYRLPLFDWYKDTSFYRAPFDPRLVYDRHEDRFIAVMLYRSHNFSDSRILISFSLPLSLDSVSWTHYQINVDSIYTDAGQGNYWADYPRIAINGEELFVSLNIFDHDGASGTNALKETMLLQIEKVPGYAGAQDLNCKEWKDIKNADMNLDGTLYPVSESFQSPDYGPGCFLLSNYAGNSTKFFWYELTGDINDPNAVIVSHLTATSFFYDHPSYASQFGGNGGDRLEFEDCRIHTGLYQNGKLHFVFHRSDNGWGEIVYASITPSTNSFFASTWGGVEEMLNSMYPAMAPFGNDSTEENFMITYQRTGPTIFPELCVINYDSGWSPSETVVKQGLGIIDQIPEYTAPWDSLERIGDYTAIQRRFNDPNRACWIAGSFAAGPMPNHFGASDGIKTWIAEVSDTFAVNIPEHFTPLRFALFPNPMETGHETLYLRLPVPFDRLDIKIRDLQGHSVCNTRVAGTAFKLNIPALPNGLYFVELISNQNKYETQKLLIHR